MATNCTHRRTTSAAGLVLATTLTTTACAASEGDRTNDAAGVVEPTDVAGHGTESARIREPGSDGGRVPHGSEHWRQRRPSAGRIAAYTTRISAPPGTRVGLKVSTTQNRYRVSAYRIGWYPGGTGTLVWRSAYLPGHQQAAPVLRPAGTRTVVAPWRRSLTVDTTGWVPGFYVLKLRTG